ncbi:hypothetical protein ERJ75_001657000 [Trypanosoma vivax]|nr:hypothetical protein ERJ75_001657000 [Trypanosoma vivax]
MGTRQQCADAVEKQKEATDLLHGLYRRLRKEGEERQMLERAISVHSLETNIRVGLQLLRYHTKLVDISCNKRKLPPWRLLRRFSFALVRRYYAWRIFAIRLWLHSTAAISDALVYTLFLVVSFMLYQIYRACRIGVIRAEERYKTLAIPIVQTFEALEEAARRQKEARRREMEDDVVRQR